MKIITSLREALDDDRLLGQAIAGESWAIWRALLMGIMGEPLTPAERELFALVTGRSQEPDERVEEFWGIMGRRSGKTRAIATLCSYLSTCVDWTDCLATGERGVLPVLAASTTQAGRAFMHITGILQNSPDLAEMIEGEPTSDCIQLSSLVDITIHPANFRTVRGITAIAAVADELAFWHVEGSKNPDHEILDALRPSLDTTEGPLLVISSPYARRGELFSTYDNHYGEKGDKLILVAKGASKTLNSTLKQSRIDRAYARDHAKASAEYGAQFRTDIEAFVSLDAVKNCVSLKVLERLPAPGTTYHAFVDPSGGSADSFTLAIGHQEGDNAILDLLREERPPFSPEGVVSRYCADLKRYGISEVTGDRYAGEWPREQFRKHGITYEPSARPKSELYGDLLPMLNSGRADLLDIDRLRDQLVGLERRTARGGKDSIDHAPGRHDDVANAVAGVLVKILGEDGFDLEMWKKLAA
ncbi:MAG: hypothetical protein E6Q77_08630 [Rhizobium sp.]|nr:MAG: hypothetical protein E6Q77_08630 [Rhizobium sp.]